MDTNRFPASLFTAVIRTTSLLLMLALFGATSYAQWLTTCPDANPYDNIDDSAAIDQCLANYDVVVLEPEGQPGYVGYIIANTLHMYRDGGTLSTQAEPNKVNLVADPSLQYFMMDVFADNFTIGFIRFDGNRYNRPRPASCDLTLANVNIYGHNFLIQMSESSRAICASGMVVNTGSSGYLMHDDIFYDNGCQPEECTGGNSWADGLTVYDCTNATIRDNQFAENTDVDLGVNGGTGCSVYRNYVYHWAKYGFAGVVIGDPCCSGGEWSENNVTANYNLLGFGIVVGVHVWVDGYVNDVQVYNNVSNGAVINLAVDGVSGASNVFNNTAGNPQGNRVLRCDSAHNYTAGHLINGATADPGYESLVYDNPNFCHPE